MNNDSKWTIINNNWTREFLIFLFLILITFLNDREDFSKEHAWIDALFIFTLLYLHFQIHRFLILPFLDQSRYVVYTLLAIIGVTFFTALSLTADYYLTNVGWFDDLSEHKGYLTKFYFFSFTITIPVLVAIHSLLKQYDNKIKQEKQRYLLRDMELRLLKEQSKPHFLFNALNSLYGLSLEKPNELPEKILQMSDIIRYQLHTTKKELITLDDEFLFLRQYIDFESDRMRFYTKVDYQIVDLPTDNTYRIAPMLLIFFVENSFKHVSPVNDQCYIKISIATVDDQLEFHISNTYQEDRNNPFSMQLGLENVEKRIQLLYPLSSKLSISKQNNIFSMSLSLSLLENENIEAE